MLNAPLPDAKRTTGVPDMASPLDGWLTTEQVAEALGITTGRVRQLARRYQLGTMVGRGRLYSPADVDVMRSRKTTPGRSAD